MATGQRWTLQELADSVSCQVHGDPQFYIEGLSSVASVGPHELCYVQGSSKDVELPKESVALIRKQDLTGSIAQALITENPQLAFARIAKLFVYTPVCQPGIHPTAIVAESADIDASAYIGPGVVIGERVSIAAETSIAAGCVVGDDACMGAHVVCHPRVSIYPRVSVGDRSTIHSGVVLGCDGFGNVMDSQRHWHAIPQLGRVRIGNDVTIGANTTIDCGALDDTVIEEGVRLDNQIQIAHNVRIGAHSAIAGCVGIAGSAVIGRHCQIGGGSCIAGHITLADGVIVTGMSMVTRSIAVPGIYSSGTGLQPNRQWHKSVVRFRQLDDIARRLKILEKGCHDSNDQ